MVTTLTAAFITCKIQFHFPLHTCRASSLKQKTPFLNRPKYYVITMELAASKAVLSACWNSVTHLGERHVFVLFLKDRCLGLTSA